MNISEMPNGHLHRLLVVDDDPAAILLLGRILGGGPQMCFATSGATALERLSRQVFDLVLLDAEMPEMSGFELCASIRSDPRFADLQVIFITAHTDPETESRALEIGAADFIHKPFNPAVVQARVRTQLALKQKTDELRRLSAIDPLTGIANRRVFDQCLTQEWRRAMRNESPLSLLLVDVDHFKRYNDRHGHQAGDQCLRGIAGVLAQAARRGGELSARYGGEEFALVLPHTDLLQAYQLAGQICRQVEELAIPHADSGIADHVTVSIGVAAQIHCFRDDGAVSLPCHRCEMLGGCCGGADRLVALADAALYTAKRDGRNRACMPEAPALQGICPTASALDAAA